MLKKAALAILAVLTSGTLFAFSLPPASIAAFGWFALLPILLLTKKQGFLKGFIAGLASGLTAAAISVTPLYGPTAIPDGMPHWNIVGFGLYGVVLALITGSFAEIKEPKLRHALPLAAFAVLVELITFIKLPAHLALTQFANPAALTLASITGIWGVSFVLWLAHFTVATADKQTTKRLAIPGVATCALLSQTLFHHLPEPDTRLAYNDTRQPYGLVQTTAFGADELLELQKPLAATNPKLAVWPELSVTSYGLPKIQEFAQSPEGWPVVTTYHDDHQPKPHNTAVAVTDQGISEPYYKRQPFGEESKDVTAGTEPVTVHVKSQNVGLNICFDSCFPWVMRETANTNNPDLIALPTLDPASPNGFIQAAHAAFTPFRAAELGIPIVRAEATAWSMVVDAKGKIHRLTPIGWEGVVAQAIDSGSHQTIYRKTGDWFLVLCLAIIALGIKNPFRNS